MVCACNILVTLVTLVCCALAAGERPMKTTRQVLVIGDDVYSPFVREIPKHFVSQVNIVAATWSRDTPLSSTTALAYLDQLLGRRDGSGKAVPRERWPEWDLIHLNVGLGDLIHRVPDTRSFRVLPIHVGGVVATTPQNYEANVEQLIRRIKREAPAAKLVWASTTPIRHSRSNVFVIGAPATYNAIAEQIMRRHDVEINDLHTYVVENAAMNKPAAHGADPFNFHRELPLARRLAEVIAHELDLALADDAAAEK